MAKSWDTYRNIIVDLYADRTLAEVRQIMQRDYGFDASTRAYRGRLIRWGVRKYNTRRADGSVSGDEDGGGASSLSDADSPLSARQHRGREHGFHSPPQQQQQQQQYHHRSQSDSHARSRDSLQNSTLYSLGYNDDNNIQPPYLYRYVNLDGDTKTGGSGRPPNIANQQPHTKASDLRSQLDIEDDLHGPGSPLRELQQPADNQDYLIPWHLPNETDQDDIYAHSPHASFQAPSTVVVEDRGESDHSARKQGQSSTLSHTISDPDNSSVDAALTDMLISAMALSAMQPHGLFLPLEKLDRIVTYDRVRLKLERVLNRPSSGLAHQICDITILSKTRLTSRKKLFAIMAIIGEVNGMPEIIEEGLFDNDLPFELDTSYGGPPVLAVRRGEQLHHLTFCRDWSVSSHKHFHDRQWALHAPFLKLQQSPINHTKRRGVRHLVLKQRDVLPIISCQTLSHSDFGDVYKVQFHQDHHIFIKSDGSSDSRQRFFALKNVRGADIFQAKRKSLQILADKVSPHLVKLLGSIEHGSENYLILPCAHGNLHKLWEEFPHVPQAGRDVATGRCMASQILGLSKSLRDIHACKLDQRPQSTKSSEAALKYGTHGDIKPSNILWFLPSDPDTPSHGFGLLQLSDFGLSNFSDTPEAIPAKGVTPQYRPPEYEEQVSLVSQKSDVWAFACVLVEILTWYLRGLSGLTQFEESRRRQSYHRIMDNAYFELEVYQELPVKATTHSAVEDHLQSLSELSYCPEFALDLIQYIKAHLLRIKPHNRMSMRHFVPILENWSKRCSDDVAYVTGREQAMIKYRKRTLTMESDKSTYSYGVNSAIASHLGRQGMVDGSTPSQPSRLLPESTPTVSIPQALSQAHVILQEIDAGEQGSSMSLQFRMVAFQSSLTTTLSHIAQP
ncbi:kinase-like domain-containing protein [Microdochium trichocladiopsis]|uniref:Kinase-like domain-containing protein n=1 Tax=Microdochium trichocladiopsis TaxID=1682393 RepID=A0A9P8Y1D1_9PEZI|nr:kinase-like domain-containing protein [Microdochium trichocladiopsis]KAH7026266.1 kinase-like domain-containing protein [Microdochium trichocladiopsis]